MGTSDIGVVVERFDAAGLDRLVFFHAVCESGGIAQAAVALGSAPGTVRSRMADLEKALGGQALLTRGRFGLTPRGEELRRRTKSAVLRLVHQWQYIERTFGSQSLRIAATGVAIRHILPAVIDDFARTTPGVAVTIRRAHSSAIPGLLADHLIDFGVGRDPRGALEATSPDIQVRRFRGSRLVVAVPRTADLEDRSVDAIDRKLGWIVAEEWERGEELLLQLLKETGRRPRIRATVGTYEDALLWAARGRGAMLVSEYSLSEFRSQLELVPAVGLPEHLQYFPEALMWIGGDEFELLDWQQEFIKCFRHRVAPAPPEVEL